MRPHDIETDGNRARGGQPGDHRTDGSGPTGVQKRLELRGRSLQMPRGGLVARFRSHRLDAMEALEAGPEIPARRVLRTELRTPAEDRALPLTPPDGRQGMTPVHPGPGVGTLGVRVPRGARPSGARNDL